jgi:DNA-directed RNA polymerase subunit RPC12/RpoP
MAITRIKKNERLCKKCQRPFDKDAMVKVIEGYACPECWNRFIIKESKK